MTLQRSQSLLSKVTIPALMFSTPLPPLPQSLSQAAEEEGTCGSSLTLLLCSSSGLLGLLLHPGIRKAGAGEGGEVRGVCQLCPLPPSSIHCRPPPSWGPWECDLSGSHGQSPLPLASGWIWPVGNSSKRLEQRRKVKSQCLFPQLVPVGYIPGRRSQFQLDVYCPQLSLWVQVATPSLPQVQGEELPGP